MNAMQLLSYWRRVREVLRRPSLWFILLRIAEAGERGITRNELDKGRSKRGSLRFSLATLSRHGLVTESFGVRVGQRRPHKISTITPAGLALLGLQPMPEADGSSALHKPNSEPRTAKLNP